MIMLCGRCFSFEGFADDFARFETLAMAEGNRDKASARLSYVTPDQNATELRRETFADLDVDFQDDRGSSHR